MKITFTIEDQENGDVGVKLECDPPIRDGDDTPAIAVSEQLLDFIELLLRDEEGEEDQ